MNLVSAARRNNAEQKGVLGENVFSMDKSFSHRAVAK